EYPYWYIAACSFSYSAYPGLMPLTSCSSTRTMKCANVSSFYSDYIASKWRTSTARVLSMGQSFVTQRSLSYAKPGLTEYTDGKLERRRADRGNRGNFLCCAGRHQGTYRAG